MAQIDRFWIVWCPDGERPPRFRHPTEDEAKREAARLARIHRGKEFYVAEIIGLARVIDVEWVGASSVMCERGCRRREEDGDEIPF